MFKLLLVTILASAVQVQAQTVRTTSNVEGISGPARDEHPAANSNEPSYQGKPLSYWLNSLRNRDSQMAGAFEAIWQLGPRAVAAVPELERIVSEPFEPIEVGIDDRRSASAKLREFQIRSRAVDSLRSIGLPAASSARALAKWALTERVIAGNFHNEEDRAVFIDLVGLDVLERMRVASAIAAFLPNATVDVADLLKSRDDEAVKLAVAILNERSLPIAAELLKSGNCTQEKLGLKMLAGLWPVVSRDRLVDLNLTLSCPATTAKE